MSSSSSPIHQRSEEDNLVLLASLACAQPPILSMMENCIDFLSCLDSDTSLKILMCLDDPTDIVRVSCVSRSWRHYVIANGLCKKLCLKMFPQLSRVACVVELNHHGAKEHAEVGCSRSMEWLDLEREHRVYAYLARVLSQYCEMDCIANTIGASSTDNYPQESIDNTLEPRDNISGRYSYWSSTGQSNPDVPEALTYGLISPICVIKEIDVQPFKARFQVGAPIYSAKSVRFKMGHPKAPLDDPIDDEKFEWTYTSPVFPMTQENRIQKFKLPEPVLCIGGILQIELLGRVQRQEMDGLLYVCVSYVQVVGCPLSPAFGAEILEPSGTFLLKFDQLAKFQSRMASDDDVEHRDERGLTVRGLRDFPQIVTLLGGQVVEYDWFEEEYEVDDDFEEDYAL